MKKDQYKTKEQLINELGEMRQRIAELEVSETEHGQMEEALLEPLDFNNIMFRYSPAFYIAIKPDGEMLLMNESLIQVLGYSIEEVKGNNFLMFIPDEEQGGLAARFERLLKDGESKGEQNYLYKKNGQKILTEWYNRVHFDENGEGRLIMCLGLGWTSPSASRQRRH
jgi:PAS domain S-box-containing protein